VIDLPEHEWVRLFKEVFLVTLRMTKDSKQRWTQRDRAQEATETAFERLYRLDPRGLDDRDPVFGYLVGAARSELGSTLERAAEEAEPAPADPGSAAEKIEMLRASLKGDRIGRATIDLLEKGVDAPDEQARSLGVDEEEIYNARARRRRAMARVVESRGEKK
jgi:hypothetical protein